MSTECALPVLFDCPRTSMRLTEPGCGRLWRSVNLPKPATGTRRSQPASPPPAWHCNSSCWACPTGMKNAGVAVEIHPLRDLMRNRCGATGAVASRLVHGAGGVFDMSQCNRRKEAERGTNGKGSRPRICAELMTVSVAVVDGDAVAVKTFGPVRNLMEVMLTAARTASGATVAIGAAPAMPPDLVTNLRAER